VVVRKLSVYGNKKFAGGSAVQNSVWAPEPADILETAAVGCDVRGHRLASIHGQPWP
jgi:hypothetical protein